MAILTDTIVNGNLHVNGSISGTTIDEKLDVEVAADTYLNKSKPSVGVIDFGDTSNDYTISCGFQNFSILKVTPAGGSAAQTTQENSSYLISVYYDANTKTAYYKDVLADNVTVGQAMADGDGNTISDTYVSNTYLNNTYDQSIKRYVGTYFLGKDDPAPCVDDSGWTVAGEYKILVGYKGTNDIQKVTPNGGTGIDNSKYLISVYHDADNKTSYYRPVLASNVTVNNAEKWNGYSISVVSSLPASPAANTIYLVG